MKEIKISQEFKNQTIRAVLSIILFVIIYLLMLVLAVGLTAFCVYTGVMLIVIKPMIITLALGIGLASLGVLVLFFLLKFIFKSHKVDRSHLTEIKKADEPKLFKMIDDIIKEVGTDFPKKVYLSSDVNASVFYDSSFWSMLFPIKKNLQIGLGLVNTVTQSELKAILSHEFGHFSQKTMKVGSYVYNVNQVIFNLLVDNEAYDELLQKWANASGYFSIFVVIAFKIIEGIKWVLKQVYDVVNKSYMALSREMEFHADEIAANVTGYEPLKDSLLRLHLTDYSFNSVLSFYDKKIADNLKSDNIYNDHLFVTNFLAKESNIQLNNNLPQVSEKDLNKFNKSKLVIKDQWASHPSTEDRVKMLEKTGLSQTNPNNEPANLLFTDIEKTQNEITQKIFTNVVYSGECSTLPVEGFQSYFKEDYLKNTFSKIYNSYYDIKNPLFFDVQHIEYNTEHAQLEDLFSQNKVDEVYTAVSLQSDIELIKQISDKTLDVKTFDYEGIKYFKQDCQALLSKLKKELEILNEKIRSNDIEIFKYFKSKEQKANLNPLLENLYIHFFNFDKEFDTKYDVYIQLSIELQFTSYTTPFEQIRANFNKIEPLEKRLKKGITEILESQDYQVELTKEIKENFELYLSKKWQYFGIDTYENDNLQMLFSAVNNYAFLLSRGYFLTKQKLLNYQVELINTMKNNN
ncbi:MAG TPA: M48 family metalloprotease [Saprospiraceae bacterium]|nr:M48 family metalloprotease [Saprospiraceae bacterium]HMU02220.1 M48 family metalloprotease [Saprospiraceae bacterium]